MLSGQGNPRTGGNLRPELVSPRASRLEQGVSARPAQGHSFENAQRFLPLRKDCRFMRVITGSARGTKLVTAEGENTRPTSDKVKEAVDRASIEADLKVKAAIELVREKAVVTEVEPTPAPSIDSEN